MNIICIHLCTLNGKFGVIFIRKFSERDDITVYEKNEI